MNRNRQALASTCGSPNAKASRVIAGDRNWAQDLAQPAQDRKPKFPAVPVVADSSRTPHADACVAYRQRHGIICAATGEAKKANVVFVESPA